VCDYRFFVLSGHWGFFFCQKVDFFGVWIDVSHISVMGDCGVMVGSQEFGFFVRGGVIV